MITFSFDRNEQFTMESAKVACDICGAECPSSSGCVPSTDPRAQVLDKLAYAQAYRYGFARKGVDDGHILDCCRKCKD
jgi:hypothetical protein